MKPFIIGYLLVGMMMAGTAVGRGISQCPHDSSPKVGAITEAVAMWPVFFAAAISLPKDYAFPPVVCEAKP